ncbi:MAG: NIL domain-containing protein [Dehalococcoidia bacterium]
MAKRKMKFIFPAELITEPVVYYLGQDFRLATIIQRGDLTEDHSWVILEMEGSDEDIEQGLSWVAEKGITVQPLESEVV